MALDLIQPSSTEGAIAMLSAAPAPFDTPTQRLLRSRGHLTRSFEAGQRRPEWVWAGVDESGVVRATIAGLGHGAGLVLDHFGAIDPAALPVPLAAATSAALALPDAQVALYAPAGLSATAPEARTWLEALRGAGWRLLVERCHYAFTPEPGGGADVATSLHLERPDGPDDPRLFTVQREILRETLDAHDRVLIERVGLEAATHKAVADLLAADPWECVRLAYADGSGEHSPVGLVCWNAMARGRGYLAYVGVVRAARGHGFGRQLVALATAGLLGDGATTLIADTDRTNHPMVRAFAEAGWPSTETRIDFVPG